MCTPISYLPNFLSILFLNPLNQIGAVYMPLACDYPLENLRAFLNFTLLPVILSQSPVHFSIRLKYKLQVTLLACPTIVHTDKKCFIPSYILNINQNYSLCIHFHKKYDYRDSELPRYIIKHEIICQFNMGVFRFHAE